MTMTSFNNNKHMSVSSLACLYYCRSKLFLMSWCPDSAKIKKKMIYSSSFDTLKRAFVGVHKVRSGIGNGMVQQNVYFFCLFLSGHPVQRS